MARDSSRPAPRWWSFEGAAGTLKSGRWVLTAVDSTWEFAAAARLRRGRRLRKGEWPTVPPVFAYDAVVGKPDVCWTFGHATVVVSDRLRKSLERLAPGAAEFRPVRVRGPRSGALGRYWAVNWLRECDCASRRYPGEVNPARIPPDLKLGVLASDRGMGRGDILVRDDLKMQLAHQKFRGLRFGKVHVSSAPKSVVRRKVPGSSRFESIERRLIPSDPRFDVDAYFAAGCGANDPTDVPNETAFHQYVRAHSGMGTLRDPVVLRFLKEGADPNVGDSPNLSSLLVIMTPKSPRVLRALQKSGANWNCANSLNGFTPLMSAAVDLDVAAVRLMLQFGADPNLSDLSRRTAMDHLAEVMTESRRDAGASRAIRNLLVRHGARKLQWRVAAVALPPAP